MKCRRGGACLSLYGVFDNKKTNILDSTLKIVP